LKGAKIMNLMNRMKSWGVWVSVAGAAWVILSAFGLPEQWGITSQAWNDVLNAVGTILIAFGILNNPTDKNNF
jgi:uncharacterized membrane protein